MKTRYFLYALVILAGLFYSSNWALDRIEHRLAKPVLFTCVISPELPDYFQELFKLEDLAVKWKDGLDRGVFVASGLNGWAPMDEKYRMNRVDTFTYTLEIALPPGELQYKYTFYQTDKNGEHIVWLHDLSNVDQISSGVYYGKSLNSVRRRKTIEPYRAFMNSVLRYLFGITLVLLVGFRAIRFVFRIKIGLKYKFYFSFMVTSFIILIFVFVVFTTQMAEQVRIGWINQSRIIYKAMIAQGNDIGSLKRRAGVKPVFLSTLYAGNRVPVYQSTYDFNYENLDRLELLICYFVDDDFNFLGGGAISLPSEANLIVDDEIKKGQFLNRLSFEFRVFELQNRMTDFPKRILFMNRFFLTDAEPLVSRLSTIAREYRNLGRQKFFQQLISERLATWYLLNPYEIVYYPVFEGREFRGAGVFWFAASASTGYMTERIKQFFYTAISILFAILILAAILIDPILGVIAKLTGRFTDVSRGNFGNRIQITTRDELQAMGESFNAMLDGLKAKQQLLHYVSRSAWESAHKRAEAGEDRLQGESKIVTLLFSDIKGFTPMSNSRSPREVVDMLNAYFDEMTKIIARWNGQIDKFIGDAIMAVYDGDTRNACERAVRSAIEMQAFLTKQAHADEKSFQIRIGINTGEVIMGDIGSLESRRDYTCIGDNVNKTQRLESLCAPGRILLSQESFSLVRDHINTDKRADLHVKGFKDTVTAYEIIEPVWTPFPPETNKPTE